ncbi:MAG: phage GP46 family protein [Rhodospirillales bacterium]|nr:phage GP46 family protein [Rhodospirillales bacterium]
MDIALLYDPVQRRCDVAFAGKDFVLDQTPASAMLMSLFADRRAHPDDEVPAGANLWSAPPSFVTRRGWCGDGLDPQGRFVGSRLWLLARRKESERTRQDAEGYVAEALDWLNTERNLAVQVTVRWQVPGPSGMLSIRVRAGETTLALQQAVG